MKIFNLEYSSLLNVLSGFIKEGVSGDLNVNGRDVCDTNFHKRSTYIMQDENLYGLLTLKETMNFAFKFKTGSYYTKTEQRVKVKYILDTLRLDDQRETFVKNLSGGQKKRLAIALELVDDPPVLFLDEPTSGLDSSSSRQCIELLKAIALRGKTVICTIHSPSATIFNMFNLVYALSDGICIYQGSTERLHPFLDDLGLPCPPTYSLSDHLLEVATDIYGPQNNLLNEKIENGKNSDFRSKTLCSNNLEDVRIDENKLEITRTSFLYQIIYLIQRNLIFNIRDKSYMLIRLLVQGYIGITVGLM